MKTIIAGSRTITSCSKVLTAVEASGFEITEVVSGTAKGVDQMGERYAAENGLPVKQFPEDWKTHGKAAGPIRNKQMADYADAAIVVWDGVSKGSRNMAETMRKLGKPVCVLLVLDEPGNTDPIIGHRLFVDGFTREVFQADDGTQYVYEEPGRRVTGLWLHPDEGVTPAIVASPGNRSN